MGILLVCLATSILFISSKPTEGCSRTKDFTFFDLKNPDAHDTCKRCPTCPPGRGLTVQCGSRIPKGTFTGCKPCEVNKSYSEKNDISHCKPCNQCGFKIVRQQCTPLQNSKCADACIPGYKLDPVVDACYFEGGKNISTTTTTIITAAPVLSKRTSATILSSVGTSTPVGGIVTTSTKSSTPDPNTDMQSKPTNNTQTEVVDDNHGSRGGSSLSSPLKDQDSKHVREIKIIVGCVGGVVLTVLIIVIYIAFKQKRSMRKTRSEGVVERGERLPLKDFHAENKLARFHNVKSKGTSLLGDQSNTNSTNSSTDSLDNQYNEASGPKNDNLDVQRIPEDSRISDMLWLRDQHNEVMLFYVQDELDPIETLSMKTWRSVALVLDASPKVGNIVETSNRSMQSPTEPLLQYFKTKGDEEPSMRDFVEALVKCKRHEVARSICNWPWEINARTR